MNDCAYYEEQISTFLDGMLTAEEQETLKAHLNSCGRCTALYRELAALSGALHSLQQEPPAGFATEIVRGAAAARRRRVSYRSFAAMAAVFVLAVLGAGGIRLWSGGTLDMETAATASKSEASAGAFSAQAAPSPVASPAGGKSASGSARPKTGVAAPKQSAPLASAAAGSEDDSAANPALPTGNELNDTAGLYDSKMRSFAAVQPVLPHEGPYFAILTAISPVDLPDNATDTTQAVLSREEFDALLDTWKAQNVQYTLETTGDQIDPGADTGLVIYQQADAGG